jgi:DNA polymerase III subunit alpha, Gram-positive type
MAIKSAFTSIAYYIYLVFSFIKIKLQDILDRAIKFAPNITESEIIYFDFETTGLNPYHEKIIDYAFLVEEEESGETYIEGLIDPEKKFEKKITDITGIHPEELEGKPVIRQELDKVYNFINYNYKRVCHKHIPKRFLVAHNCDGFDKIFLMKNFTDKTRYPLSNNWYFIDTLPLAKRLLPKLSSHSLKALTVHYNIKPGTHRALSDTVALRKVFDYLLSQLSLKINIPKSELFKNPQKIIDYYNF